MKSPDIRYPVANQVVAYTASAGNSSPMPVGIHVVRVLVTTDAHVKIGAGAVATTSDMLVPANRPEYFKIYEGERVSAIQDSAGGSLHVTQLTQ